MHHNRRIRCCSLLAAVAIVAASPAAAVKRRAFVTSVTGTGDLSSWPEAGGAAGLAAGDAICRARANAAGLPNSQAYRAWLSSATTDAYCHVKGLSGPKGACTGGPGAAAGPWYLANGVTNFTGDVDELTGPEHVIYRPVMLDELMNEVGQFDGKVWTGTRSDGTASMGSCSSWTSAAGDQSSTFGEALATAEAWTARGTAFCDEEKRLLCFEPGASEPLGAFWSAGALVFATSVKGTGDLGSWPQADGAIGLAAGDAICRNLAAAAHLPSPGSFVAWLSTDAVNAVDRLTTNGPFKRIDGFSVAGTKPELVDGTISNSFHQDEAGHYLEGTVGLAWTGTQPTGLSSGLDCNSWTQGTDSFDGTYGYPNFARTGLWSEAGDYACDWESRLYCLSNLVTLFWDGFDSTGDTGRWSSTVP